MFTVAVRDSNMRQPLVCCWQHLATTVDVASAINSWATIVECWSHTAMDMRRRRAGPSASA